MTLITLIYTDKKVQWNHFAFENAVPSQWLPSLRKSRGRMGHPPVYPMKVGLKKRREPISNSRRYYCRIALYCRLPEVRLAWVPIASPETTSSTLRLAWRPDALSFEATGTLLPKPVAVTELATTPCCTR